MCWFVRSQFRCTAVLLLLQAPPPQGSNMKTRKHLHYSHGTKRRATVLCISSPVLSDTVRKIFSSPCLQPEYPVTAQWSSGQDFQSSVWLVTSSTGQTLGRGTWLVLEIKSFRLFYAEFLMSFNKIDKLLFPLPPQLCRYYPVITLHHKITGDNFSFQQGISQYSSMNTWISIAVD